MLDDPDLSEAGDAGAADEAGDADEVAGVAGVAEGADPHGHIPAVLPTLFPFPPSWSAVFGRRAPLEVELGFGRPHFLLERGREAPERDIVGLEWKGRWPRAVWEKQARGEVPNVRAVHGNAWLLFGAFFAPGSLRAVTLNFPDPWWKSKHRKRRIVSDTFARLLASRLEPGGMVLVQTDVASLLEELLGRLEAQRELVNPNGAGRLAPRKPVGASSHREERCRREGVPIFRGVVVKRP